MRLNLKTARLAAVVAGAAAGFAASPAAAEVVGQLTCNIAPGAGQLIASRRAVSCTFRSAGPTQFYRGSISRLGLDLGNQTSGVLTYSVIAVGLPAPGVLAGSYVGPGFGLTLGAGGGLNALVGGGGAFALQPIAGTASTGVNINAGIGELRLGYVGLEGGRRVRRHARHHRHGLRRHR